MNIIRNSWSSEELEEFVSYALKTLGILCKKHAILDPDRIERLGVSGARASIDSIQSGETLKTYWTMKDYEWWLHSSVASIIALLVKLNPELFYTLVRETDDPVVHLRAARCATDAQTHTGGDMALQWLTNDPDDALVALAIVQILDSVNELDSHRRLDTEKRREQDVLDPSASNRLECGVEKIGRLEPLRRAHWVVELLSHGTSALNASGQDEKPLRVEHLEELCIQQLECLARSSWSDELVDVFRTGLCLTPLVPRTLPLAQVAFDVRDMYPERSARIARLILDTHEQQIVESLEGDRGFFYNLSFWQDTDWVNSLAVALVLNDAELDVQEWAAGKCRALPLSVWDFEEDHQRFFNSERVAQFRFLVALHAIQMLERVGSTVVPANALALAEDFWKHCQFAGRHIPLFGDSDVSALAARVAVHLGEPTNDWVLDQTGNPGIGPRALWALIHQRVTDDTDYLEVKDIHLLTFMAELHRIASARFGDPRGLGPTELYYLGELWLLLGRVNDETMAASVAEEAKTTAMVLVSLAQRQMTRAHRVLALKLLTFASSKRRLPSESENKLVELYRDLWTSYTPTEERFERQQIDDVLRSSEVSLFRV
ncbi:MAG: hypothetical protein F4Z28_02530 [Gammaproteobacteria bacterium]|nr:hypothetical protein [Gammaproteobacteria bacterium]